MSRTFDRTSLLTGCVLLLSASACAGNPSDASPSAPAPATPAAPAVVPAPVHELEVLAPSAQQLPVAEDFEAEAAAAINAKSYKQELAALGSEIEQDMPQK